MLASRDGHPAVFIETETVVPGKFAAMSSSITALGKTIIHEVGAGRLSHVLVEGDKGKVVFVRVPYENGLFVLAVLAAPDILLGRMHAVARTLAKRVDECLRR